MPTGQNQILSVENIDIETCLDQLYLDVQKAHIFKAGFAYFKHFTDEIFDVAQAGGDISGVVLDAQKAGVPDGLIKTAIYYAQAGYEDVAGFDRFNVMCDDISSDYAHYKIYAPDAFFEAALTNASYRVKIDGVHDIRAGKIWTRFAHYIWQGARLQVVTNNAFLNSGKTSVLMLSDFVSQDGEIYFEMLDETVGNMHGDEISIKGMLEVLSLLGETQTSEKGQNLVLAFLSLIQGMAAKNSQIDGHTTNEKCDVSALIDAVLKPDNSASQAAGLQMSWLDEGFSSRIKNIWHLVDVKNKRNIVNAAFVTLDPDDTDHLKSSLSLGAQIKLIGAMQRYVLGAIETTFTLEPDVSIEDVKKYMIEAWGQGVQYIDFYRLRSGWDEPLLSSDYTQKAEGRNQEVKVS